MKLFLQNNDIEMHLTHNEGKSVILERFIRILKKIYIDKLHDVVNKYNNTYLSIIKMKSVDGKSGAY